MPSEAARADWERLRTLLVGRAHLQVQGLMEVFGRGWCNIYLWTPNGSAMFHVRRDRAYWAACVEVLADFWWANLVPAKHALAAGKRELVEQYRCCSQPHPCACVECSEVLHMAHCTALAMTGPHVWSVHRGWGMAAWAVSQRELIIKACVQAAAVTPSDSAADELE